MPYCLMLLGWTVIGIIMLIAAARFGNAIHESFGLLPGVGPKDTRKESLVRSAGLALLGLRCTLSLGCLENAQLEC